MIRCPIKQATNNQTVVSHMIYCKKYIQIKINLFINKPEALQAHTWEVPS